MTDDTNPQVGQPGDEQADERLLAQLRAVASHTDPVPDTALLAARSQFAYLRMDAELAELTYDSAVMPAEAAGMRSDTIGAGTDTASVRRLTFEASSNLVEVEVIPDGDRRRLIGQCVPATEATLLVRCRPSSDAADNDEDTEPYVLLTRTDDLGRFSIEVPAGDVLLRCVWQAAGLAVETTWVRA